VTAFGITLAIVCQLFLVVGQLLLKRGMNAVDAIPRITRRIAGNLTVGILCLTLWFFLWLGLLARWDLSKLFPFEGMDPALLVLGAWIFLKEKLTPATWLGIALISAGIALVSGS
jgi:undecaprenyl phosphate-alpha-L-ara4N flippase subunit ArnE